MANTQIELWPESTILMAKELENTEVYYNIVKKLQELIYDPNVTCDTLEEQMRSLLTETGYKQKLRNLVYQLINKKPIIKSGVVQKKEPLDFIRKAQANWEKRIIKSLNNMSNELSIAFSRRRPVSEQKEFEAKWFELGIGEADLSRFRPVYSQKDFLDVLVNVKSPNLVANASPDSGADFSEQNMLHMNVQDPTVATIWGLVKVPLKVKDFQALRLQFEELSGNINHLGLDVLPFSNCDYSNKHLKDRVSLGKQVLEANYAPVGREYCKRGCPATLRADMWCLILGVDICGGDKLNFKHLKSCVFQHELLIDKLIFKDINLTASNDDQYFVFEDLLYQILLVFSRDTQVASHFERSSSSPPRAVLRGSHNHVIYPPNGIIPFHGFSMYVAPLCYIYEDPVTLYYVFRELYCRYFFRLHCLSCHPQGALSLCLLFETLLHELEPQLAYHFATHDIHPIKIAVKWVIKAFSGCLATDQILQLWDCILAYDSTEILSILAVGIMSFRRGILLQAESQAVAENMLADVSGIKVIPILHGLLCAAQGNGQATSASTSR